MPMTLLHVILDGKYSPALPIGITIGGAVLLFLLSQIAMRLYRMGDVNIYVKRMADLDPKMVRLNLDVRNANRKPYVLNHIRFATKIDGKWVEVSPLSGEPIQRKGDSAFVQKDGDGGYNLFSAVNTENEVVLETELPEALSEVCLVAENHKGKTVYATVRLDTFHPQGIIFHRD